MNQSLHLPTRRMQLGRCGGENKRKNIMENKINIAELLKDCPKGMELDCTMFEEVTLLEVTDSRFPIKIAIGDKRYRYLTETGGYANDIIPESKCIIFPKGKTTWEGFVPPCKFKEGDVVTCVFQGVVQGTGIFDYEEQSEAWIHVCINLHNEFFTDGHLGHVRNLRLATEEEIQKLFKAIKDKNYKWDAETKALVPNKFDITTLKPFDKVLVRSCNYQTWTVGMFSFYCKENIHPFACVGGYVSQCIPYEENKHLLGTTDDCDDFYKTWE